MKCAALRSKRTSRARNLSTQAKVRSQVKVGRLLNNNPLSDNQINQGILGNNSLLEMSSVFEPPILAEIGKVLGADFTAVNWAKNALSSAGVAAS